MSTINQRVIKPLPASDRENGTWLWALEDTRERTRKMVDGLTVEQLDFLPPEFQNSIGTLLYHIALIEADYLCTDVLGHEDYLPELHRILPLPDRDGFGRLSVMTGVTLDEHLARFDTVRAKVIEVFSEFTRDQLDTPRLLAEWGYEISPAWTLHHLMQHEAEHRGEIGSLITLVQAVKPS
jgi:uncharacterized damage-inducible protein DinB